VRAAVRAHPSAALQDRIDGVNLLLTKPAMDVGAVDRYGMARVEIGPPSIEKV
jgi:hypothetical protein